MAEFTYSDHGSDKIGKDMEYLRDYYPLINGETTAKKCKEKARSQQINIVTEETEIDNDEEVRTTTYTNRQNLNKQRENQIRGLYWSMVNFSKLKQVCGTSKR